MAVTMKMMKMRSFLVEPTGGEDDDNVGISIIHDHRPAIESPPLTIKDENQPIFIRLLFSQMMVENLVVDQ